jgi:transcriptional regulator with XRE-family HTH domain
MKINPEHIKRLRMEKHWSQEQLSEICGLNLRTIQRLETSGRASLETIRALAAAFGIDPKDLQIEEVSVETSGQSRAVEAIRDGFLRWSDFAGTSSRFEYWCFFAFVMVVAGLATVIHEKAYQVVGLIVIVPFLAAGTRRLNDAGQSGWWQLIYVVPFGAFLVWYFQAMASQSATSSSATSTG